MISSSGTSFGSPRVDGAITRWLHGKSNRFFQMPFVVAVSCVFSLSGFANTPAPQPTYFYGPEFSSLVGVIKTVTFPGPPNYESIKHGDEPEHCWILFLDQPISVFPKKGSKGDFEDLYRNVRKLHLVVHSDKKIEVVKKKQVRVTGTFFSAHTGHHHTNVLMEVERIEVLK
jgi:hypothetical protein